MPEQVLGEQVVESGEITLGEGGVPVLDASDIRMLSYGLSLRLLVGESRSLISTVRSASVWPGSRGTANAPDCMG